MASVNDVLVAVNGEKWSTWGSMVKDGQTVKVLVEPGRQYKVTAVGLSTAAGAPGVEVQDPNTGAKFVVTLSDMK